MIDDPRLGGSISNRPLDLVLVNSPIHDYGQRERVSGDTLPSLGMAYIATVVADAGFNVALLDAEQAGMSPSEIAVLLNGAAPRWVGFNLLSPAYETSANSIAQLQPQIRVVVGGPHARARREATLRDPRMRNCHCLIVGEAEHRVLTLLRDPESRAVLPETYWLEDNHVRSGHPARHSQHLLAPNLDALPILDRRFVLQEPRLVHGQHEVSMVGTRGCPYECSFCGAAASSAPDVTIRSRSIASVLAEMRTLHTEGIQAVRFVDDLFLGTRRRIHAIIAAFCEASVGGWLAWRATGRINLLDRESDDTLHALRTAGLSELALGVESGSLRILNRMDKRITPTMAQRTIERCCRAGINVKAYFIVGSPGETSEDLSKTVALIQTLRSGTAMLAGTFRASAFLYRPYPGTRDWRLLTQEHTEEDLLSYIHPPTHRRDARQAERDEFDIRSPVSVCDIPPETLMQTLVQIQQDGRDTT